MLLIKQNIFMTLLMINIKNYGMFPLAGHKYHEQIFLLMKNIERVLIH